MTIGFKYKAKQWKEGMSMWLVESKRKSYDNPGTVTVKILKWLYLEIPLKYLNVL